MKVAVASGKGGTGKTTVATNLARVFSRRGHQAAYLDCDVEEPNGHLFLHPEWTESLPVHVPSPSIAPEGCTGCGLCSKICTFKAISSIGNPPLLFPELCHSCGGCWEVCPEGVITPRDRKVGELEEGKSGEVRFVHGRLRVGEVMASPLIHAVRKRIREDEFSLLDAPPGTACAAVAAVNQCDYILLVTEPTPFGLHDLGLALDMVSEMNLPHGVAVNRHTEENGRARTFCRERGVPILAEIPLDRRMAEVYSRGELIVDALPEARIHFEGLADRLLAAVRSSKEKDHA